MAFKPPSWRWLTTAACSRVSWLCPLSGRLTRSAPFWAGGSGGGSDGGSCCCGRGGGCIGGSVGCCKCVTCSVGNILRKNESSRKHARSVAVLSRMRAKRGSHGCVDRQTDILRDGDTQRTTQYFLTDEPHTHINTHIYQPTYLSWATLTALYVSRARLHTPHTCTATSTGPCNLTPQRFSGVYCTLLEGQEVE